MLTRLAGSSPAPGTNNRKSKMNFYVTSSIPYVNGEPHLGHAMEFIMADVLARHARDLGEPTFFSIGTDEHGGKVAEIAKKQGLSPKVFADKVSLQFIDLAKSLNISNDRFIRTTDEDHETRAKKIWQAVQKDIYKGSYVGWYCTGDEAFVSDLVAKANKGICPTHQTPYEKIEEDNYFFKLSKYTTLILEAVESNKFQIIPKTRRNEILQVIKDGLDDISISRPKEKISWGISVPRDDSQVMYVWFEALLNYITVLGYPDGENFKFWPANYQIIGKDILRFHAAIWPAILMSLDLALPSTLFVHGFINIDNQKMSKSLGNYVVPSKIIETYGSDALRYFLLRHIPSYGDGDFSWQKFHDAYQNELGNELGNAVQRTAVMVNSYVAGQVDKISTNYPETKVINDLLKDCHFDRALDRIWEKVKELNQYIDEKQPWQLHKQDKADQLKSVLSSQVDQLITIADLLNPFMPDTASRIRKIFTEDKVQVPKETLFPRVDNPKTKA